MAPRASARRCSSASRFRSSSSRCCSCRSASLRCARALPRSRSASPCRQRSACSTAFQKLPIWDSLRSFAYVTRLNDIFWWLIEETVWPNPRQKNYHYNVVIVIAVCRCLAPLLPQLEARDALGARRRADSLARPASVVSAHGFCRSRPGVAAQPWHVLSVTMFAYFLFWNERLFLLPWRSELWMREIILLPPLIATALLLFRRTRARRGRSFAA